MVNARGSDICQPCAATERGQRQIGDREDANRRAYRVGEDRRDGFKKALFYWEHGYRMPKRKE